jgi:glycosyltransferase involved in cell wall biosynthesis
VHTDTLICCIPTKDCRSELPCAIASLLRQSRPPDDVYVIDDGSSDVDEALIARFPSVTFLRSESTRGPYAAVNQVVRRTESAYVALQDADDWSLPRRFEHQLYALRRFHADGCGTGWYGYHHLSRRRKVVRPPSFPVAALLAERPSVFLHATAMYPRSTLTAFEGFDERLPFAVDKEFQFRAAVHGLRLVNIPHVAYIYSSRPGSLTRSAATGLTSSVQLEQYRAYVADLRAIKAGRKALPPKPARLGAFECPTREPAEVELLALPSSNVTWKH